MDTAAQRRSLVIIWVTIFIDLMGLTLIIRRSLRKKTAGHAESTEGFNRQGAKNAKGELTIEDRSNEERTARTPSELDRVDYLSSALFYMNLS